MRRPRKRQAIICLFISSVNSHPLPFVHCPLTSPVLGSDNSYLPGEPFWMTHHTTVILEWLYYGIHHSDSEDNQKRRLDQIQQTFFECTEVKTGLL